LVDVASRLICTCDTQARTEHDRQGFDEGACACTNARGGTPETDERSSMACARGEIYKTTIDVDGKAR